MHAQPKKIVSLLPMIGHPRDSKRIAMLQSAGYAVEAVAFEREGHQGRLPTCPTTNLGRISHGKYLSRAFKMLWALPVLHRALKRGDIAYASSPDMALFALFAGFGLGRPLVLEVGDIRHIQIAKSWKGRLTRALDRFIARRAKLLVVTTQQFADDYYKARLNISIPVLLLENKLDEAPLAEVLAGKVPTAAEPFDRATRPLRIGYFGVLRCGWSRRVLEHLARALPQGVEVITAGYFIAPDAPPVVESLPPNVRFRGGYQSPQDLPSLYQSVDVIWACYPGPEVTDPDWRWALKICRSNRFYESCFFRRPIISMRGSGDGNEIDRLGIGLTITDQSDEGVLRAIAGISPEDLAKWNENLSALPKSVGVYTNESQLLADAISKL